MAMTRQNENRRFALAARARLLARGAEGAASLLDLYNQLQGLTEDLIEAIGAEAQNSDSVVPVSPAHAASPERIAGEASNPVAVPAATVTAPVEEALPPMTPAPAPAAANPPAAGALLSRRLRRPPVLAHSVPAGVVWQTPTLRLQA
jgi:hypothetical protein